MKIYNYDGETGEYTGQSLADMDPMEGYDDDGEPKAWLIPANATTAPPPAANPGNVIVFRGGKWGYVKLTAGAEGDQTPTPHGPDSEDVAKERNRRLAQGFGYDFGDDRGLHFFATTPEDMVGWDEVTKLANALIMSGSPDETIGIMTGTGPTMVTAMEWQQILIRAGAVRQPLFSASFGLQEAATIPADYQDDKYWPENGNAPVVQPLPGLEADKAPHIIPSFPPISENAKWIDPATFNPNPDASGPEEE